MKAIRTVIHTNPYGLEFEVEQMFVDKDDFGNPVNEWCINEYSLAKMIVYKEATELLPPEEEHKQISAVLMDISNAKKQSL